MSPRRARARSVRQTASASTSATLPVLTGDTVRPASREDILPVVAGALFLAVLALVVCFSRNLMLLYGDAVAHMGIARRIVDSRNPGLAQLGGVWLPLPHLVMLPFIGRMEWWQNGMAGAWPSLICYVLAVAGVFRLSRRILTPTWSLLATAFFALNANLLYSATTALTEPLFLAIFLWLTVLTMEAVAAVRAGQGATLPGLLLRVGLLIVAAVYTRYDGWILGAIAWCLLAVELLRNRSMLRAAGGSFALLTLLALAAPAGWLWYNHHFYGDALDFLRGPYSATAIEKKTSPPGSRHYRGWHNPLWALLFYTRTAQVVASASETGFLVLAAALAGVLMALRRRIELASLLLWVPLPFYIYSIAFGSVPIFIPQLWPHSFYNARYGLELLPALAVFSVLALSALQTAIRVRQPLLARVLPSATFLLIALSTLWMMYRTPLVLQEGKVNARTRVPFEAAVARELKTFPPGVPILMYTSDHIGAIQTAGLSLRQLVSEGDRDSFNAALEAPAEHAAFVVAIANDPVDRAVKAHPEGLTELSVLCTMHQPCARIFKSDRYPGERARP